MSGLRPVPPCPLRLQRQRRQWLPAGDRPHAEPGVRVVGDPREVPAQLDPGTIVWLDTNARTGGKQTANEEADESAIQELGRGPDGPHQRRRPLAWRANAI
jgi:hypothetical protein